jgi:hypothetical protein
MPAGILKPPGDSQGQSPAQTGRLMGNSIPAIPGPVNFSRGIAASRIAPGGRPYAPAPQMDSKFIGINALP